MSTEIQETINRLRELDRYASPAPWEAWGIGENGQAFIEHPMGDVLERGERRTGHKTKEKTTWLREADADLITETRNSLPALLTEIDRLTTENKKLAGAEFNSTLDAVLEDLAGVNAILEKETGAHHDRS